MAITLSAIPHQKTIETASFADFTDEYGLVNYFCHFLVFYVMLRSLELKGYHILMNIIKLQRPYRIVAGWAYSNK